MRKYDVISALSEETSKRVTRNEESWKKYLNTASRLYKYPFKDQLLIYAQRPDATACASIEIWNEKMHCWVNKGAKGIALLDEEGSPYAVLKRCGMEDAELAEEIQFPYIHEFNTIETLSHIGDSISDLSKPVLMEIGKAIGAYDREIAGKEASRNSVEKGLANTSGTHYNALKCESKTEDVQLTTQTGNAGERGNNNESDLREERGLSDTDVKDGRTAGGDTDEIRTDEEELLTGTQEGDLHRASAEREAERASSDHSGAGGAEDGTADRADDEAGGSDGETQGREPDALGSEDEQHQALGGGNRAEGTGIQPVSEGANHSQREQGRELPDCLCR